MGDEESRKDVAGSEMQEETPQPAQTQPVAGVPADSEPDVAAGEGSPAAAVPQSGDTGSAKPQGGIKGWFATHKMLAGAGIGILAALLVVGIFFIGYFVGKPCKEPDRRVPARQFQYMEPQEPDLRSVPSPGRGEDGRGRLDLLIEFRDEVDEVVAGLLSISTGELQEEIEAGKTIAEIAEEKGVSSEDLKAAVVAEIGAIADQLAADGEIGDAQAENIKSNAKLMAERYIERGYRRPLGPSE